MKFNFLLKTVLIALTSLSFVYANAQTLEDVIVEEYANDEAGPGQVTYRVFVDMGEGDVLLAVYGFDDADPSTGNPINFNTTTTFYQDAFGSNFGEGVNSLLFPVFATAAYDTWVSVGAAATGQAGIPLTDDTDGSALNGNTPDGYTAASVVATNSAGFTFPGTNLVSEIGTPDGAYFVAGGAAGVGPNNTICIGQFTTDGDFSFQINFQLQNGDNEALFLHTNAEQPDGTFGTVDPRLSFPITDILGCTDSLACNFDETATADDNSCIIAVENCTECNDDNTGLVLIDTDGDGVCDADEVEGCTNPVACNFNNAATEDDGTCTDAPVENCSFCVGQELTLIDTDGDGICDADEVVGCTNPLSCNYDPSATDDNGSCSEEPVADCTECEGDDLVLIDTDGDGVCDADEVLGCTNPISCNYDSSATDDDGSCSEEPVADCSECDGEDLVFIDTDGDGVCDADEVLGCTDMNACNFDPSATEDDDLCVFADDDCEFCNEDGTVGETLVDGGSLAYDDGSESQTQCVGDDIDYTVSLVENEGPASAYVVTTSVEDGLIVLGVQESNTFNFAGASPGNCLIWNLSYDPENSNVADVVVGETSALDLTGCYDLSNSIEIIREDCSDDCQAPFPSINEESLAATYNGTTIVLSWDPIPGAIACQIQGREAGTGGSAVLKTLIEGEELGSYTIAPFRLDPATTYEWRVRCGCSVDPLIVSEWSAINTFTTPAGAEISSSPNPTEGVSFVNFTVESDGMVTLEVFDLSGRSVASIFSGQALSNNNYRFEFDGSGLPNGIYLYRLFTEREVINEKFMIAR